VKRPLDVVSVALSTLGRIATVATLATLATQLVSHALAMSMAQLAMSAKWVGVNVLANLTTLAITANSVPMASMASPSANLAPVTAMAPLVLTVIPMMASAVVGIIMEDGTAKNVQTDITDIHHASYVTAIQLALLPIFVTRTMANVSANQALEEPGVTSALLGFIDTQSV
jgi:hypothetical protein